MDSVHETVQLSNMENINDILETLSAYQSELENIDDVDIASQMVGIASLSVAIESTKLWHQVFIDSSHPLHDMIGYFNSDGSKRKKRRRKLDQDEEEVEMEEGGVDDGGGQGIGQQYGFGYIAFDYIGIVESDIEAATEGGLASFQEILATPFIVTQIIGSAIMGSGRAAFADIGFIDDLADDYVDFYYLDDANPNDDNDDDDEDDDDEEDDDDFLTQLLAGDDDIPTQIIADDDDFTENIGIQDGLFMFQDEASFVGNYVPIGVVPEGTSNVVIMEEDEVDADVDVDVDVEQAGKGGKGGKGGKNGGKGGKNEGGGKNGGKGGKNGGKGDKDGGGGGKGR